jgi:flagellar hook assembly protein FlgD
MTPTPTDTPPPWCNGCNNGQTTFSITLYNSAGELVKTITTNIPVDGNLDDFTITNPTFSPQAGQQAAIIVDGKTYFWNGTNSAGQQVTSGVYYVKTEVVDNHGNTTVYTHPVTVIVMANQYSLKVYNSAGELVDTLAVGNYGTGVAPTTLSTNQKAVAFGPNGGQFIFNVGPGTVTWNGENSQGQLVQQGGYTVQLVTQGLGSAYTVASVDVTVLSVYSSVLAGAFVAPNPVPSGQDTVTVALPNATSVCRITGRLYDVAGELVMIGNNDMNYGRITFNIGGRRVAGGIYIVALTAIGPWGQAERNSVHFVIVH